MTRLCPVCHLLLRSFPVAGGVEVEYCVRCAGIWFDKDELTAMQDQPVPAGLKFSAVRYKHRVLCGACGHVNRRDKKSCAECGGNLTFACPACGTELEKVSIHAVSVDRCPGCRGVWIDGEELQKLFEQYQAQREQKGNSGSGAADAAATAMEVLIWNPNLLVLGGHAAGQVLSQLPEVGASVLSHAGDLPEVAGHLAEGAVGVASHAAEASSVLIEGALEAASHVPEIASSFLELIADLISGLLD